MKNNLKSGYTLILGHTGYIGKHTYKFFKESLGITNLVGKSCQDIDLTQLSDVVKLKPYFNSETTLIMFSGIKKQFGDNLDIFLKNMKMIENLSLLIKEKPIKRMIYLSSAEVYGETTQDLNITEQTPVNPTSYYGISKFSSECLLQKRFKSINGQLLILRPTLVYGPDEIGSFYGPLGFIRKVLNNEKIVLWGNGNELREFIYIDDIVRIISEISFTNKEGILNIVSGTSRSFKDIIEIISTLNSNIRVDKKARSKDKVDQAYDNSLLKEFLPSFAFSRLEEGVNNIYKSELKHE